MRLEQGVLEEFARVTRFVVPLVIEMTESLLEEEGEQVLTAQGFQQLVERHSPPEVMNRLDTH